MKAALEYFLLYLLFVIAGSVVLAIPVAIILLATQGMSVVDELGNNMWFMSSIIIGGNLLTWLIFWKKKYTRYNFNVTTDKPSYNYKQLYLGAALACLGCLVLALLIQMIVPFPDAEEIDVLDDMMTNPLGLLGICILAPLAEESVFRGAIERTLLEKGFKPWIAILVAAGYFVIAHFNLAQGSTALIIGACMGWVYYRTRSVWPCIFMHALNNTTASLISLKVPEDTYNMISQSPAWEIGMAVGGLLLLYVGVKLIANLPKAIAPAIEEEAVAPAVEAVVAPAIEEETVADLPVEESDNPTEA